eukprot:TRINITY_DN9040_c0_g1_i1.p1 TRINITY_DN9040_c0_g1~~TRINITY_DN9040_c0_g1_i1.p1  ORF type:complete len:139 (+),score=23.45 TRINITY_DN9040_c0_g1_i1:120-536(+)
MRISTFLALLALLAQVSAKAQNQTQPLITKVIYSQGDPRIATRIISGVAQRAYWGSNHPFEIGSGERTDELEVKFDYPFTTVPALRLTVKDLEMPKSSEVNFKLTPKSVSKNGYVVHITVWGATQIYMIGVSWLAAGK